MCEHLRMSSQDDPEARIRDLERSLGEQSSELTQSSSEMGSAPYGGGYTAPPPSAIPVHGAAIPVHGSAAAILRPPSRRTDSRHTVRHSRPCR